VALLATETSLPAVLTAMLAAEATLGTTLGAAVLSCPLVSFGGRLTATLLEAALGLLEPSLGRRGTILRTLVLVLVSDGTGYMSYVVLVADLVLDLFLEVVQKLV
jgi:hypothetical protein